MFCAECTLLDIHRDFAGNPAWLRQEGTESVATAQGGRAQARRERYRCPKKGCGARWVRLSDSTRPDKRCWEMLLD